VLDDDSEHDRLRRNAVKTAELFTWEQQAERLRHVYGRIGVAIAQHSRASSRGTAS
jgi:hypothetical protein